MVQDAGVITVNGEPRAYVAGMTVASLLASLPGSPVTVVVEINGTIILREKFGETPVNAKDSIEIVHFVGGG